VSPAYIVLRAKADPDLNYLKHQLHVFDLYHMKTLGAGVRQTITFGDIGGCFTVLPPLPEQAAIADFLGRETAKINELIAEQERLIELLKEKRQAVISHAVNKGLNPDAPMKDSGIEWLGKVPEHWSVGKSGFYLSILSGFAFPSSGFSDDEAHTRLLRGINVGVMSLKWDETVYWQRTPGDDLDIYEMKAGDLVIGMDRPLIADGMRVCKVGESDLPCLLLQRVASIKTGSRLNADYLLALLSSEMFVAHFAPETTGVSVPHISPEQICNFVIPVPPREEQDMIGDYISRETGKIDGLAAHAQKAITLLQERRSALISAAVTGQIDVRGIQHQEAA
jgi:type I restriction enzyme S subunit